MGVERSRQELDGCRRSVVLRCNGNIVLLTSLAKVSKILQQLVVELPIRRLLDLVLVAGLPLVAAGKSSLEAKQRAIHALRGLFKGIHDGIWSLLGME